MFCKAFHKNSGHFARCFLLFLRLFFPLQETGDAVISVTVDGETAGIEFRDRGIPFDPLARPDPDVTLSAEERGIGGLGIYMVKKTMDEVLYRRENGENVLTIRKKLQ